MKYTLAILAACTLLLAALGLYLLAATGQHKILPPLAAASTPPVTFTQPFTLTSHNGAVINEKTMLGKPSLYFFGFTHCPDICPTTLGALTNWLNQIGDDSQKFNVLFVSVDPERDTPESLKAYTSSFHPQITGATGTPQQLETMAKNFMVYYAKVPVKEGENPKNYMMSHSSMILLADKNGTFQGTLDAHDPDAEALTKLRELLKN